MAPKEIIFSPNAEREIKKLGKSEQKKILAELTKWRLEESRPKVEKIKSQPDFFRLKAGSFRIVYYPLSVERVVLLLIRDRKDVYKNLGDLSSKLRSACEKLDIALPGSR